MSTATAVRPDQPSAPGRAPRNGGALAGTGTLIRFNLRRDRIRLPVWVFVLLLITLSTASSLEAAYPDAADRARAAETMNSPQGLAMSGPAHYLTDYHYGSMLAHQTISFASVLVGIMSVLIITRHTRTEEETGRAELVRAGVVGRHAHLTAALSVAVIANAVLGLLHTAALSGYSAAGFTAEGALLYGAQTALIGIVFAAVAAVTVQITPHSRGASGWAMAVIGASYAIRAAGDAAGADGSASWLSWLSPIGWVLYTYPYVDNRWWPLLICLAAIAALVWLAFRFSVLRDLGAGLRAARPGRPVGSDALATPLGFALRLHRGLLIGFAVGLALLGLMYGSILGDAEEMMEGIDALEEAVAELGGSVIEAFATMIMIPLAVVAAIYAVMAPLRARSEETSGRAEPLLATGLSRTRWLAGHLVVGLAGSTLIMALGGFFFGLAGAASSDQDGLTMELTGAALAYAPAFWVTVGVAAALIGWLPRAAPAAWAVPAGVFLIGYLGVLFDFPQWVMNLDPFGHVPDLPSAEMNWTPLAILTAVAVLLLAAGLAGIRRRDLELK
ncbi:ABC transporter permease [Streptomyces aidingensis]|uniref:ABC-2 type transport system permease protein n=1 Tax=Streptomyces aidingensis TaxID=910347 RepID=A0A1I1Q929_9ACTN|nr:ABC transporter permease [Streptomyces aidingensis]SFD15723.1 ABC-2 type transport system permease protein [Streptomyces aidingensis]